MSKLSAFSCCLSLMQRLREIDVGATYGPHATSFPPEMWREVGLSLVHEVGNGKTDLWDGAEGRAGSYSRGWEDEGDTGKRDN